VPPVMRRVLFANIFISSKRMPRIINVQESFATPPLPFSVA
jgi:hypothetical protein